LQDWKTHEIEDNEIEELTRWKDYEFDDTATAVIAVEERRLSAAYRAKN